MMEIEQRARGHLVRIAGPQTYYHADDAVAAAVAMHAEAIAALASPSSTPAVDQVEAEKIALAAFFDALEPVANITNAPPWREQRAANPEAFDREANQFMPGIRAILAAMPLRPDTGMREALKRALACGASDVEAHEIVRIAQAEMVETLMLSVGAMEAAMECAGIEWVELIRKSKRGQEDDDEARKESKAMVFCLLEEATSRARLALASAPVGGVDLSAADAPP